MSCPEINVTVGTPNVIGVTIGQPSQINVSLDGRTSTLPLQERVEIEGLYKVAKSTKFTEYIFVGGDISRIDVWQSAAKTTKLFTKTFAYVAGNIDTIAITDETNGRTLTKAFAYTIGGDIETKTEVYA